MPTQMKLSSRAILSISGPEARGFLQGLVTNDAEAVTAERAAYAALLTPQGKILFDFLMIAQGEALLLDCAREKREALQKRLTMYKLRAKVEIAPRNDLAVFVQWDGTPGGRFADPRLSALGYRAISPASDGAVGDEAWLDHRLSLGAPEGGDFGQDRMFALDAGLDELHAISFTKGCYVGQELTARMKHRGAARKRLLPVTGDAPLPAPETPVLADGREVGALSTVYGMRGFALLRLDRLEEAGDAPLTVDGARVTVIKPSWLSP